MKDNQQTMTVKQREGFETTLREALNDARKILSVKTSAAEETALRQILEETGAVALVVHVRELNSHLDEATKKLEALGFEFGRGDDVRLTYQPPEAVQKKYEALVSKQVEVETKRVNSLHKALGNMWAVTTVPEAREMLGSFAVAK
jgi:hypothetical protein